MFPNFSRDQVQFISLTLFLFGSIVLIGGGWQNELMRSVGISLMAGAIWFVIMSESILLTKVQNEMHGVLEKLSIKREKEIVDLLFFLRQAQLSADPLSSWQAANGFVEKIQFPAMTMSREFKIAKANDFMTNLLGYKPGELNGVAGHKINDAFLMSTVAEIHGKLPDEDQNAVHSRYLYLHKSGTRITGTIAAWQIDADGFFIVFHPDENSLIKENQVKSMVNPGEENR